MRQRLLLSAACVFGSLLSGCLALSPSPDSVGPPDWLARLRTEMIDDEFSAAIGHGPFERNAFFGASFNSHTEKDGYVIWASATDQNKVSVTVSRIPRTYLDTWLIRPARLSASNPPEPHPIFDTTFIPPEPPEWIARLRAEMTRDELTEALGSEPLGGNFSGGRFHARTEKDGYLLWASDTDENKVSVTVSRIPRTYLDTWLIRPERLPASTATPSRSSRPAPRSR